MRLWGSRQRSISLLLFIFWSAAAQAQTPSLRGSVLAGDAAVQGATVRLLKQQTPIAQSKSTADGGFSFSGIPDGDYVLEVRAPGFSESRTVVHVPSSRPQRVSLTVAPVVQEVTVTAVPGEAEQVQTVSQSTNIISSAEISARAKTVLAQAAQEEEGLALQRTSPTIGAIYVRGLTGAKVNTFVDGVRYSTAAARGGINTFFNLNDPTTVQTVEVLRGPSSAQYGSDSIGGTVQLVTAPAPVGLDKLEVHGSFGVMANYADAGYGSNATVSVGSKHFGWVLNLAGRRANSLRPGQGLDSHSAFTRFFGLPSSLFLDSRLPDTSFTQYGGSTKLHWAPNVNSHFTAHYAREQQDGGRRYDQLLGGDGNNIADLRNLMGDFFYARFDRIQAGWLDRASLTYSFNSQREERVNQGGQGNPAATINHEPERTSVHGVQALLDKKVKTHDLIFGAELYHERVDAPSFGQDPVTLAVAERRGRVPDNALYRSGGVFLQDVFDVVPGRLKLVGAVRYSAASYRARAADSPLVVGSPLWPDDSLRSDSVTFRAGAVLTPVVWMTWYANFSRGFRAPHITDLGTLGLTGSGFEVAAPDIAGLGGTVGSSAAADAVSTGLPVTQVGPETSMNYEGGVRLRWRGLKSSFAGFVNDINDNITKQALILPPGAVGLSLGGQTIVDQSPTGAVFVPASTSPVLVRTNYDDARIWGFEHRTDFTLNPRWSFGLLFTYLRAEDKRTGLAPNIEGGTPAPDGYLRIRYTHPNSRWWVEPYLHAALDQERLSSLDLEDRRTGALRTRSQIANFFHRGATVRGYVGAGPDLALGTPDDLLLATGETVAQIQDRVLGVGVTSAPLYTAVPGYATFNVRGGFRISERQSLMLDFENIGDRNYRGISWGVDAPGRSLTAYYRVSF